MFIRLLGELGKGGPKNGATGSLSSAVQSMHVNFPRSSQKALLLKLCMQHHDIGAQ